MYDKLEARKINMRKSTKTDRSFSHIGSGVIYKLMKEYSELTEIVEKFREYKVIKSDPGCAKMLEEKPDKEFREMLLAEIDEGSKPEKQQKS